MVFASPLNTCNSVLISAAGHKPAVQVYSLYQALVSNGLSFIIVLLPANIAASSLRHWVYLPVHV